MTTLKKLFVATVITAGVLAASVPFAASAYKKHTAEMQSGSMDAIRMMIEKKDLPVVEVADPV